MRKTLRSILFFFLPVFCLVFFQMEKGRMGADGHKFGYSSEQSDVSVDVTDDSSIIATCDDDDDDDSSESIARILPVSTEISIVSSIVLSHSSINLPQSRQISYRDVSPSFLRVFRI